jgi:hypothetical protein
MSAARVLYFREIGKERADEFYSKGYKRRYFFPHRAYYLPKCGPDGFKLARRMCAECELNGMWEIVIYADQQVINEFPQDLFFDNDLIWHQQQFGRVGQIASANLVVRENSLYSMVHISDLVQRISRRREFKTRIENRFKGWNQMLLNSILNFALENNLNPVYSAASELAIQNTDPARTVARELFERVYDMNVEQLFKASKTNGWWSIDVVENQHRIVRPVVKEEQISFEKMISLCHDIERGFGHTDVDATFAKFAHGTSEKNLKEMLAIEKEMGVQATYNVLGLFLPEVKQRIEEDGHCLAFHSYDHWVDKEEKFSDRLLQFLKLQRKGTSTRHNGLGQLDRCRQIDFQIKGYRPPQSKITPELTDGNLAFHNFEWLASSEYSLGMRVPELRNRIVKIPILFDDFEMYKSKMQYEDWEEKAIESIKQSEFVSFSLHDCYGHLWLPYYRGFLEKIMRLGELKTLNEVASNMILSNAI